MVIESCLAEDEGDMTKMGHSPNILMDDVLEGNTGSRFLSQW